MYQSKHVWIELKTCVTDDHHPPWWDRMIEDRVKQLAMLLGSSRKPQEFRIPQCLGYIHQMTEKPGRNLPAATTTVSLLDIFRTIRMPSLTKRKQLAQSIAQSLMYLHSVNWPHKAIRSNNINLPVSDDVGLAVPTLPPHHQLSCQAWNNPKTYQPLGHHTHRGDAQFRCITQVHHTGRITRRP